MSNKQKPTPGPWRRIFDDRVTWVGDIEGDGSESVCHIYSPNTDANASLIAAAPELLEFAVDVAANYDHDEDAHKYDTRCRVCEAEKVIAKATGEVA